MPDLLLEFFSEEIPARMQARAAEDLKKLITDRLVAAGLVYEGAKAFATPRRPALAAPGGPPPPPACGRGCKACRRASPTRKRRRRARGSARRRVPSGASSRRPGS